MAEGIVRPGFLVWRVEAHPCRIRVGYFYLSSILRHLDVVDSAEERIAVDVLHVVVALSVEIYPGGRYAKRDIVFDGQKLLHFDHSALYELYERGKLRTFVDVVIALPSPSVTYAYTLRIVLPDTVAYCQQLRVENRRVRMVLQEHERGKQSGNLKFRQWDFRRAPGSFDWSRLI